MKRWPRPASMHRAPQPSGGRGACIEVTVKWQLRYVFGTDRWRLFQPETVLYWVDTKDGVPSNPRRRTWPGARSSSG